MTPWYKIENSILYRLDRLAERNGCLVNLFWSFPSLLLPLYQNFKYQVMNVKRHFWTVACTVLFICSSAATAQEVGKKMPDRQERGFKPMPLSPEKSARHATDRMNSLLNLTEKQYDKLYKLNAELQRKQRFWPKTTRKPSTRRYRTSSAARFRIVKRQREDRETTQEAREET